MNTRINILQWILTKLGTYLILKRIWNPVDFLRSKVKFLGEGIHHALHCPCYVPYQSSKQLPVDSAAIFFRSAGVFFICYTSTDKTQLEVMFNENAAGIILFVLYFFCCVTNVKLSDWLILFFLMYSYTKVHLDLTSMGEHSV